jgi:hypothetical protein
MWRCWISPDHNPPSNQGRAMSSKRQTYGVELTEPPGNPFQMNDDWSPSSQSLDGFRSAVWSLP